MKAKEKRMILILVLIAIVLLVVKVIVNRSGEKQIEEGKSNSSSVVEQEDGSKRIESEKITETKKLGELEITNIGITEENGLARVRANITNPTSIEKEEFPIKIKLLNKQGEVIQELGAYVGKIKALETKSISASVNMDISEVYDIKFE